MTPKTKIAILEAITANEIRKVYSGKPGCRCGCKGTYSQAPARRAAVLTKLKQHFHLTTIGQGFNNEFNIDAEIGGRYYTAYLNTEAGEVLAAVLAKKR